jgi:hypothetical protein
MLSKEAPLHSLQKIGGPVRFHIYRYPTNGHEMLEVDLRTRNFRFTASSAVEFFMIAQAFMGRRVVYGRRPDSLQTLLYSGDVLPTGALRHLYPGGLERGRDNVTLLL